MVSGGADRGDVEQFEEFFVREYPAIFRAAFLVVGDRELAREITQQAFWRLLMRWPRIRGYDRPGAWVRLVAVRLARRTRDRRVVDPGLVEIDVGASVGDLVALRLDVDVAVLSLPRMQRAAVVLHYMDDLSVDLSPRPRQARECWPRRRSPPA